MGTSPFMLLSVTLAEVGDPRALRTPLTFCLRGESSALLCMGLCSVVADAFRGSAFDVHCYVDGGEVGHVRVLRPGDGDGDGGGAGLDLTIGPVSGDGPWPTSAGVVDSFWAALQRVAVRVKPDVHSLRYEFHVRHGALLIVPKRKYYVGNTTSTASVTAVRLARRDLPIPSAC
jgi:hypothetical protein